MEPALVPERPSISTRPSSRNLSMTPHAKAPWAPPPWRARLILFLPPLVERLSAAAAVFLAIVIEPVARRGSPRRYVLWPALAADARTRASSDSRGSGMVACGARRRSDHG